MVKISVISVLVVSCLFLSASTQETGAIIDKAVTIDRALTTDKALITDKDVTSKLEVLGQPFAKTSIYARNVWDMQLFDGKIYLGHGNSSNTEPAPNAGPIPIYYYEPATNKFVVQDVVSTNPSTHKTEIKKYVDEEQIDTFKVMNGKLYIPGNDARGEDWKYGNYYKLDNDKWIKYRNIPNGIHVYDMAYYQGKLFAAISAKNGEKINPDVLMSEDDGITWKKIGTINAFGPLRAYTLFVFKNKLYAESGIPPKNNKWSDEAKILSIHTEGGFEKPATESTTVYGSKMLPGLTKNYTSLNYMKMVRTTVVNDNLLYIAGEIYNDQQWIPQALFVANDINDARRVIFPNPNALPMDILVRGNTVYVLTYTKTSSGQYMNKVYKTNASDLYSDVNWTELFSFKQDTYARSFEELNGDFYFGLGTDMDVLPKSTGTILRVKSTAY
jgi:hypothetical protein